jgi:hypothetical protein
VCNKEYGTAASNLAGISPASTSPCINQALSPIAASSSFLSRKIHTGSSGISKVTTPNHDVIHGVPANQPDLVLHSLLVLCMRGRGKLIILVIQVAFIGGHLVKPCTDYIVFPLLKLLVILLLQAASLPCLESRDLLPRLLKNRVILPRQHVIG